MPKTLTRCQRIERIIHAVSIDTFPGYKTGGEAHSFLKKFEMASKQKAPRRDRNSAGGQFLYGRKEYHNQFLCL